MKTFFYCMSWASYAAYLFVGFYNPLRHSMADRGVFLGLAAFFMCNAIYCALRGPAERDART